MKEKQQAYLSQSILCFCGLSATLGGLNVHKKSDMHKKEIKNLLETIEK